MKHLFFTIGLLLCLSLSQLSAQNYPLDQGISVRAVFMDYQSQNGGDLTEFQAYHHGFELGYQKMLSDNFNLYVPFKVGVVNRSEVSTECLHKSIYGLDAQLQYLFQKPTSIVSPFVVGGIGGVYEQDGDLNVQFPLGVGLQYTLAPNARLVWQSEYRVSLAEDRNNLHHGIGFIYGLNKMDKMPKEMKKETTGDRDGDGLEDDIDLCPDMAGPIELNGCPDKDGDGIADYKDKCPNYIGLEAFDGCPDSDGDGISDNDDECPNMAGTVANNGCPQKEADRDGDGVLDKDDRCPDRAGSISNNGCPQVVVQAADSDGDGIVDSDDRCPNTPGVSSAQGCPDRDGDGVADASDKCPTLPGLRTYNGCPDSDGDGLDDSRDRCPNQAGSVDNNGCPGMNAADRQVLEVAMRAVQFDSGKATFKSESYRVLNQVLDIMQRYPNYFISIEGHTDSSGGSALNQSLSEKRAKACRDYLVNKGISSSRLSYVGYGEAQPIADNSTETGRKLNRRVEFNASIR
jgi:outer membrane protein OmpA-like peptidoglycan-associated protein